LYDGTNNVTRAFQAFGGPTFEAFIIDEQAASGGALTAAYYNGCDVQFRKTSNIGGLNDCRVQVVAIEIEDTENIALPCGSGISRTISSTTAASPTEVTTSTEHGMVTGMTVLVRITGSTPEVEGRYSVTVTSTTKFTIPVNLTGGGGTGGSVCLPAKQVQSSSVV